MYINLSQIKTLNIYSAAGPRAHHVVVPLHIFKTSKLTTSASCSRATTHIQNMQPNRIKNITYYKIAQLRRFKIYSLWCEIASALFLVAQVRTVYINNQT